MEIEQYDAINLPNSVLGRMPKDMREKYVLFMDLHWSFLKKCSTNNAHRIPNIHQMLILANGKLGRVIGYRYFYHPTNSAFCELFNLYIDPKFRT